ncbi:hypothetical protein C8R46DRAFT_1328711, partial [Mycena filopes]
LSRSDIWHEDGSLVLQAEAVLFRVHWGVLSLHSSFFRDMRDLPQPPMNDQSNNIEGCPVVELHDSAADVKHLLNYFLAKRFFPFIAAIIRLSKKYAFENLLVAAVKRLTDENPMTLEKYESMVLENEDADDYISTRIEHYPGIVFDTISLAREHNLITVLPCAYFRAILLHSQAGILRGIPQDDGSSIRLPLED